MKDIVNYKSNAGRKAKIEAISTSELTEWIQQEPNRLAGIKCQAIISLKNDVRQKDVCLVLGV